MGKKQRIKQEKKAGLATASHGAVEAAAPGRASTSRAAEALASLFLPPTAAQETEAASILEALDLEASSSFGASARFRRSPANKESKDLARLSGMICQKSETLKECPFITNHLSRRASKLSQRQSLMPILAHCCNEIILLLQFYKSKRRVYPKRQLQLGKTDLFKRVKKSVKLKKAESENDKSGALKPLREYIDLLVEEAVALLLRALKLPVVPVESKSQFKVVRILHDIRNFNGPVRLSLEIAERLRRSMIKKAKKLGIDLAPEEDGGSTSCSTSRH